MSLSLVKKDITTVEKGIVAHGVNCQAVMGAGVALAIKLKWPTAYERYVELGKGDDLLMTTHVIGVGRDLYVANCYTQVSFGSDPSVKYASLDAVKKCLTDVIKHADILDLPVFLPKIASDRGGLSWEDEVYPEIEQLNKEYPDVNITICLHDG